jgi:hypothetical protein
VELHKGVLIKQPEVPLKEKLPEKPPQEKKMEPITLQAPPLTPMKVEDDSFEEEDPMKIRTGFIKEAENDYQEEDFFEYPYFDEIFEPIDDNIDFEATMVDDDVIYRLQSPVSDFNTRPEQEEVIIERVVEKEVVKETVVEREKEVETVDVKKEEPEYDDESKILPHPKKEVMVEQGKRTKEGE